MATSLVETHTLHKRIAMLCLNEHAIFLCIVWVPARDGTKMHIFYGWNFILFLSKYNVLLTISLDSFLKIFASTDWLIVSIFWRFFLPKSLFRLKQTANPFTFVSTMATEVVYQNSLFCVWFLLNFVRKVETLKPQSSYYGVT